VAIWNIDTFDSVVDPARGAKFTAPYVEGLPQGVPRSGPQDNPFEGTASILGTYRTGANSSGSNKYMHYCTRMLRWSDIDLTDIPNIGNRDTCHVTNRFGDLGGIVGYGNSSDTGKSNIVETRPLHGSRNYDLTQAINRYRFDPVSKVQYSQYTSKGMRYSNDFGGHPFAGMTCGWEPGASDSSFHWNPSSSELTTISSDIASDLTSKSTTLAKLQALDYTWNLCVIAWCWAGYRRAGDHGAGNKTYQGASSRGVNQVDIYYFPFIY